MSLFRFIVCAVDVKDAKKHIKRKKEEKYIMRIVVLGGCNWFGRDLMHKLLSEKNKFHLTWVDNLSSEYSSRHFTWDFEYLKDDCYDFKYGDINDYSFLKSIMSKESILIYNIWQQPQSIIGMEHISILCKEFNCKLIYTTNQTLVHSFKHIIKKNGVTKSIGIQYNGELVGHYDIYNKRDPIDTIEYYKKIGNKINLSSFEYYTMESVIQFIYFFIIQETNEPIFIQQPTLIYP